MSPDDSKRQQFIKEIVDVMNGVHQTYSDVVHLIMLWFGNPKVDKYMSYDCINHVSMLKRLYK